MSTLHFNALVPPFDLGEGTATEELEKANILTYGADSTGVAPSDTALKEALENSTIVYFPKGTYLFNENHKIKGQVVLYGDGRNQSTIKTNQTAPCSIFTLENAGCHIHDLKIEGPTSSAVTSGALITVTEETYGESGLIKSEAVGVGSTEIDHIETVGGWIQISVSKATAVYIHDWNAILVRTYGLLCSGSRAESKPANLVYVHDCLIQGKEASTTGSAAIRAEAGEALTISHVDTEFCETGIELTSETNFCWISDSYFDKSLGAGIIIGTGCKSCTFDKCWVALLGTSVDASGAVNPGVMVAPFAVPVEFCTFSNCLINIIDQERTLNVETWKEISETEYNALASKKAEWLANKVYAAKDGVFLTLSEGVVLTGGGRRFYEALKATKAFNPRGAWKTATSYAVKDTVTSGGLFYEAIKLNESIKPPEAVNWKEITEVTYNEGDFQPASPANGLTIGAEAKKISVIGCTFRIIKGNGVQIERPNAGIEQNHSVIGCQFIEVTGFGVRIGANTGNPLVSNNQSDTLGRGTVANDATSGFNVFNTGFNEFLTSKMGKPAEQPAINEGVQTGNTGSSGLLKTQIISYKTKADVETKVKHNLNSTAVFSVMAYKYPAGKFESKMQLAAKHVESFTVNTANEITIKWSATLEAKEEIAIMIQAA